MKTRALRTMLQDRSLRRVVLSYGAFAAAEDAAWIAVLVYAYERGGVVEAGAVAAALLVPAALLAPVAAPLGDRFRRDVVLAAGYTLQSACLLALAVATGLEAHPFVVYAAAGFVCVTVAFTSPAIGALLPAVAREPEDLSVANAAVGVLENLGSMLGPLAAAGLLLAAGPTAVFAAMAAVTLCASAAVASLGLDPRLSQPSVRPASLRASLTGGLGYLRRDLDALVLLSCVAVPWLLVGAVEVLLVGVATEQLSRGSHFAGYLSAAFGVGGLLGATAAGLMVGRRGLALALAVGGLLAGAPIAGLSTATLIPAALACLLASGAGYGFGDVVGMTLVQRSAPDRFRASVFGVLEGLQTLSLAVGAMLVSVLSAWLGLSGTLVAVGLFIPAMLLLSSPRLLAADAGAGAPVERVLAALRRDPIFAPLAPPAIERVARCAEVLDTTAREIVTREGEIGDAYFCVLEGDLEVHAGGRFLRTLGRGDSFGEIALLHAVPRTATVSARTHATLVRVDGNEFLETVTRHPQILVQATAGARHLLAGGPLPVDAHPSDEGSPS